MFDSFNFNQLKKKDFKEDSVREVLLLPILKKIGFSDDKKSNKKIDRSKKLSHPFVQTGSKKKKINIFPDYLLKKDKKKLLVLDAKSPSENIRDGKNVQQVYFYAIHPDIRCENFALCNGYELVFFKINENKPVLIVPIPEIENEKENYLEKIQNLLFEEKENTQNKNKIEKQGDEFYLNKNLPSVIIKPRKRLKKRHFGVHGYFTKQSWDILDKYIRHFSQKGDRILDPFGGSGVTFIEALANDREAIHIDLNPLSIFWMDALITKVDLVNLQKEAEKITEKFKKNVRKIKLESVQKELPENIDVLSKGADAKKLYKFFSKKQLKELGYLKQLILQIKNKKLCKNLLLAFSSSLTKINLTYHTSNLMQDNPYGGDSGIFRYYRYRLAPSPDKNIKTFKVFERKIKNLIKAKEELKSIPEKLIEKSKIYKGDATDLKIRINDKIKEEIIEDQSIDYIYTDPPYGKKIEYLDLSVMWNAWLNLKVTKDDYKREAIEGGHLEKSRDTYGEMIIQSLKEMFRVLKWNRWMSFVFQHQSPYYWYLIVENAEKIGFEYKGVVQQNNGQTSFKKRQNPFSVLSGQLIINFIKKKNPQSILKADLGADITGLILNNVEAVIAEKDGATINEINDSLVIHALELGYLDQLSKYGELNDYLAKNFSYNEETKKYYLQENASFKSHIPEEKRIQYFLISYLRRENRQNNYPDFDELVFNTMPLLKNGKTPEKQTIRNVLEKLAIYDEIKKGYKLKIDGENELLLF